MAFKPAYPHLQHTITAPEGSSLGTPAAGSVVTISGGYIVNCATTGSEIDIAGGGTTGVYAVLAEAGHSDTAAGTHDIKVYLITPESVWLADATASAGDTHLGINTAVSDAFAVKPVTSDASETVVIPFEVYGEASRKKVLCRFVSSVIQGIV